MLGYVIGVSNLNPNKEGYMTEHASLRPATFTAGGLIDDVNVTFAKLRFVEWDYNGKIPVAALAMCLEMQDEEGEDHVQYFSGGDLKNWTPSADGKKLDRVGAATGLNDNSNLSQFISSIVNAGFPENKFDDDISAFEGMQCHVLRKAQPKRTGLIKTGGDENERERTVLLVTEIHKMPWEKKASKKGKATKGKTKTKAVAAEDEDEDEGTDDINGKATSSVEEILLESGGGPITKVDLAKAIFKKLGKDSDRNKIVQLVHTEEFLTAGDWEYDGSAVSLGE